jgi:hypothetical protein
MKLNLALTALLALFVTGAAAARPAVVTYSKQDLARAMVLGCGEAAAPRGPVHAHRNTEGTMVYCVSEDHKEAILYSETQQCNDLSSETLDIWRGDDGNWHALLIKRSEGRLLMVGEAELRGKRFDMERSGRYVVVSQGATSQVSAIARPYRVLATLDIDAQRIFVRKRDLLIVGDNPKTNRLEARVIRAEGDRFTELAPIPVANMPAGVRVLDYSEQSDDLLLGGVDASGQTSFVIVNLGSGSGTAIVPQKPGDDQAMFLSDGNLRAKLGGTSTPAGKRKTAQPEQKRGFLPF